MRKRQSSFTAFTLLELLIVVSIIALLLAILLPALSAGRQAAMDLDCKANFRTVATSFILFADPDSADRGPQTSANAARFRLEDFQESIYKIDEFWDSGEFDSVGIDADEQPMMCPASPAPLERRSNMPCSSGAIGPMQNVSAGFNKRLETRTRFIDGAPFPANAWLSSKILEQPEVPLLFDVDGKAAAAADRVPYYSAPPILDDKAADIYESGAHWFPSMRHRNRINVAFIGGHVLSSTQPLNEPWWRWYWQPD